MREIKFRVWDEDNKGYTYLDFNNLEELRHSVESFEDYFNRFYFRDNPKYIQQYTGLKDKNGKEIYEGDIIDIHQTVNGVSTFVILSCIGGYDVRYYYENKPQREYEYSIYELLDIGKTEKELEIIGNIHNK